MISLEEAYVRAYRFLMDKDLRLDFCLDVMNAYYFRFGNEEYNDVEDIIVNKENKETKYLNNEFEYIDENSVIEVNCESLWSLNEYTMYKYCKMSIDELSDLMNRKENLYSSEEAVVNYFKELYFNNLDDMDLLNDVNELFYVRGYNVMFLMPLVEHKIKFNIDEYREKSKGLTNSFTKTYEFINYLKDLNDHRVTNLSLYLINIKHFVDAGILDVDNSYIKECYEKNMDLRETLFSNYMSNNQNIKDAIKTIKEKVLVMLGGYGDDYNLFPYYEFLIDTEFMLYSIGEFKHTNMIKLMFKIVDKKHLLRTKNQYSTKFEDANKYLGKIKKDFVTWYINKHSKEKYENDGYVQFYRHLEMR